MSIHRVGFKFFADEESRIELAEFVPIFHRWIDEEATPEPAIDVADYKHVVDGPGVMLITVGGMYSVERQGGRLGLRYKRLRPVEGGYPAALEIAFSAVLAAAWRLENEPALQGRLAFDPSRLECNVYDRLGGPDDLELRPALVRLLVGAYAGVPFDLERAIDPRAPYTLMLRTSGPPAPTLAALRDALPAPAAR
ncbi:hypothetical protein HS125_14575 [bacterium]|nr:hypothetical protein [bacterium]